MNTRSVLNENRLKKGMIGAAIAAGLVIGSAEMARIRAAAPPPLTGMAAPLPDSAVEPLLALNHAMEEVTRRINPTVVNISVVARVSPAAMEGRPAPEGFQGQGQDENPFEQFFGPQFGQFFGPGMRMPAPGPQIVHAFGSGVIVSPDGYIVTNDHVVRGATEVRVTLSDKRQYAGRVVGADSATDLAVVKIAAHGLPSAPWGDSSQLEPGDTVLAFGSPLGMNFTVTRGIVSALNRPRYGDGPNARGVFIQTDAAINRGNSGGPLVNARGQVIGINTEMLSDSGGFSGIGFAIPSNLVRPTADELIRDGKVTRGYLGLEVTDLSPDVAQSLGLTGNSNGAKAPGGALINQVEGGGPAAKAGLRTYDVVTSFNGEKVTDANDLQTLAGATAPGTKVQIGVIRNGKSETIGVTVGNTPGDNGGGKSADTAGTGHARLGVSVADLTSDLRGQLNVPTDVNGVVVEEVQPGSPADNAGLQRGDVIEQVNRQPVASVEALRAQLRKAPENSDVLLLIYSGGASRIIAVHPAPQQ
jgi:serine protease Do